MTVGYGNANALCSYFYIVCLNYLAVLDASPNLEGLLLALFFLTANKGNNVVNHLLPFGKGLARTGYCLISCGNYFVRLE